MQRAPGLFLRWRRAPALRCRGFSEALVPERKEKDGSLDLPGRKHVPPLFQKQKLQLYSSPLEIQEIVATAHRRCQLGAAFAAGGFGIVVAHAFASLPPAALALLLSGAAANTYALVVVARRLIRNLAARHVETLTVLPIEAQAVERKEEDGLSSILYLSATLEERLAVTRELELEVLTATAKRWLLVADPPEDSGDDLGGLRTDSPERLAPLDDSIRRLGLLHVDLEKGNCTDQALLSALVSSQKVVLEERLGHREGMTPILEVASDRAPLGIMLSELTQADVANAANAAGASQQAPAVAVERLGARARAGGLSVLGAASLFLIGENAKDPDGVPRYKNLKWLLPI